MTGEITLRGLVLPIGGLKEKTLAAKRAGIKEVIVPKRNEKDLPDIPEEVRKTLKFHFVENVDQVLEVALGLPSRKPRPATNTTASHRGPSNGAAKDKTKPAAAAPAPPRKPVLPADLSFAI